jgi:hypothetical protein
MARGKAFPAPYELNLRQISRTLIQIKHDEARRIAANIAAAGAPQQINVFPLLFVPII